MSPRSNGSEWKTCSSTPSTRPRRNPPGANLRQKRLNNLPGDIGKAVVAALVAVGQALVIDSEQAQRGRVQVVDVDRVGGDVVAEIVGLAVGHAAFNASARHPAREAARMMVAAVVVRCQRTLA